MNHDYLDPGIREVVAMLRAAGFETTDSGDGVTKPEDERAFSVPHVCMRTTPEAMIAEAVRLRELMSITFGFELGPGIVTASFDPVDGSAVIMMVGVNDAQLARAGT